MRIALDATYSIDPQPSGIAVYSRELLEGLAREHPDDAFVRCYRPKQFSKAPKPDLTNICNRLLLPLLPTFHADVFHALNQRVDRRPAKKIVSTFHDLFVLTSEYSSEDFRLRFAEQARKAAQNSDLVIAVSEFTAGQVAELLHFPRERIRVVPHGMRPVLQTQVALKENMILFVGALQVRKNVLRLVEAFEQLSTDWKLTLAGSPSGFGAGTILGRIQGSSAHKRITVTGYVPTDELEKLYARASIFAFPSLDEGFGMPVLDAMARGVPVVTSNRSALPEVAGDAAILVDPFKTEEIASALNQLVQSPELRNRCACAGLTRSQLFTWEKAVQQTYAAYQEL